MGGPTLDDFTSSRDYREIFVQANAPARPVVWPAAKPPLPCGN